MERVVVLGRGGAGKSTLAKRLGLATGLPVIELDRLFWRADLSPTPPEEWVQLQRRLAAADRWIMDGDLGPHDAPEVRLAACDTVVILDLSFGRCAWRAVRRSRERADFWWWLLTWRHRQRSALLETVGAVAASASLAHLRSPSEVDALVAAARG